METVKNDEIEEAKREHEAQQRTAARLHRETIDDSTRERARAIVETILPRQL